MLDVDVEPKFKLSIPETSFNRGEKMQKLQPYGTNNSDRLTFNCFSKPPNSPTEYSLQVSLLRIQNSALPLDEPPDLEANWNST